jgi:hypothetical protein
MRGCTDFSDPEEFSEVSPELFSDAAVDDEVHGRVERLTKMLSNIFSSQPV